MTFALGVEEAFVLFSLKFIFRVERSSSFNALLEQLFAALWDVCEGVMGAIEHDAPLIR